MSTEATVIAAIKAWNAGEAAATLDTTTGNFFRGAHRAADESGYSAEGIERRSFTGGYFSIANRTGGVTLDANGCTVSV